MRHAKNKKNRKLITRNIAYKSTKHPHDRLRELTVNVARGEVVDARYAAVDGTPIPFQSRVEQVAVEEDHGALPGRLPAQGEFIGRGTHLVYVRVTRDREMIALQPDLVRVIPT